MAGGSIRFARRIRLEFPSATLVANEERKDGSTYSRRPFTERRSRFRLSRFISLTRSRLAIGLALRFSAEQPAEGGGPLGAPAESAASCSRDSLTIVRLVAVQRIADLPALVAATARAAADVFEVLRSAISDLRRKAETAPREC